MAVKQDIDRLGKAPEGESYDAKVARLTKRLEGSRSASSEVVNAQPGYVYRWTPGGEDKSQGAIGARARLESLGYEVATDGEFYSTVAGGITWRIPTPVYEIIEADKLARLAKRWKLLGVDPESMAPTVVRRKDGNREIIETYV